MSRSCAALAAVRALTILSLLLACAPEEVDIREVGQLDYGGRVERIETLGRYSALEASLLVQLAGAPGKVSIENDYYLYRVTYPTRAVHGGTTPVSGLVAIPVTRDVKGIVSWQHGTNTDRSQSISKPSLPEGLGLAGLFASDGYILVAADYIGLGVSTEVHPYYDWPSTVSTLEDLLSIARIMLQGIADEPDRDLYLAGFSQGGGATAALQRQLERSNNTGLRLRAAATISAAFDLTGVSVSHAIESDQTLYLGYMLNAFAFVHRESLQGIVRQPYRDALPNWFDGTHGADFLSSHLPDDSELFFTQAFLAAYRAGEREPAWFYDALDAALTSDYAPRAPLRIYFGTEDTDVIPQEALTGFERMQALGGNVELVEVGALDHDEMVVNSLPSIQRWFDQLDRSSP